LLEQLLEDEYFSTIRILIRRPLDITHPKLEKKIVDFTDAESFRLALESSDVVFCAIGTTQKKVNGNKDTYRKIDYDITVNAAKFCKLIGCETFVFVSSVGANSQSNNFYLKLKGEIEEAVKAVGFKSVHIIRPSLLLGNRKEFRLGEKIAQWVMPVFSFLLPKKYRPVKAEDVGRAMVYCSTTKLLGQIYYDTKFIKQISKHPQPYTSFSNAQEKENKNAIAKKLVCNLKVKIIAFVDFHQSGIVRCSFVDKDGKEWFFNTRIPVVSSEELDENSEYPKEGIIQCWVNKIDVDSNKKIVTIDLNYVVEDSFEEREYAFDVYKSQLIFYA
jgi:dTDP-4-dehydrorhamnose reductase